MDTPYVNESSARRAQEWEHRFRLLPSSAGVIFASVWAVPAPKGECSTFEVRLGMASAFDQDTGIALIKHVLEEEATCGKFNIKAAVFRGTLCTYRDSGLARVGGDPS